ncbi:hypothetical protein Taro_054212 [Colocasia esculenta]|uniref:Uncharacterized protein n=1 Tax=Colocasia esculenta TaxID=4460 RepID=A0A843XMX9_COLES|nr:hypothetical protein [Colocasia esculenta]
MDVPPISTQPAGQAQCQDDLVTPDGTQRKSPPPSNYQSIPTDTNITVALWKEVIRVVGEQVSSDTNGDDHETHLVDD